MDKSYTVLYSGDISTALTQRGINEFMILNERLVIVYTDENFNESIFNNIPEITWWQISTEMSSLIQIGEGVEGGETVTSAWIIYIIILI